ncbi:MAG: sigma factor-like helix-turn-helix DNA-binding protein [Patescibacteria group bacterium]|nr:sigma factor-like helix-turn-helix DNA-binding protein [Patescibacteria group bacterium]
MDNTSILDTIIDNQKAEEVARLDAVEIIDEIFSKLTERERDVLMRRYGLHGKGKETLETIGNVHNLTRERIRQIETSSIKKLQDLGTPSKHVSSLRKVIYQLMEEHGGLMEKSYLLDLLVGYSLNGLSKQQSDEEIHKNYLNFLITKLLHDEFEEINNHKYFKESYRFKFQELSHLEELIEELLSEIKKLKQIYQTDKIINLIRNLKAYNKHEEKINIKGSLDVARILKSDLFEEDPKYINNHKVIFSLLKAAKRIDQNKFGHWGAHNWREIKPKTINDKINLVLKNHEEPMHFAEIAKAINKIGFDNKQANAATVHNELILDKKYILVGRGMYGLKEWGYKDGTVSDVISEILNKNEALSREEIIDEVLSRRLVKKATIILALMNRGKFKKTDEKYTINS